MCNKAIEFYHIDQALINFDVNDPFVLELIEAVNLISSPLKVCKGSTLNIVLSDLIKAKSNLLYFAVHGAYGSYGESCPEELGVKLIDKLHKSGEIISLDLIKKALRNVKYSEKTLCTLLDYVDKNNLDEKKLEELFLNIFKIYGKNFEWSGKSIKKIKEKFPEDFEKNLLKFINDVDCMGEDDFFDYIKFIDNPQGKITNNWVSSLASMQNEYGNPGSSLAWSKKGVEKLLEFFPEIKKRWEETDKYEQKKQQRKLKKQEELEKIRRKELERKREENIKRIDVKILNEEISPKKNKEPYDLSKTATLHLSPETQRDIRISSPKEFSISRIKTEPEMEQETNNLLVDQPQKLEEKQTDDGKKNEKKVETNDFSNSMIVDSVDKMEEKDLKIEELESGLKLREKLKNQDIRSSKEINFWTTQYLTPEQYAQRSRIQRLIYSIGVVILGLVSTPFALAAHLVRAPEKIRQKMTANPRRLAIWFYTILGVDWFKKTVV